MIKTLIIVIWMQILFSDFEYYIKYDMQENNSIQWSKITKNINN
jgi:hypothetical protein